MQSIAEWEVRHGGMLGLKYLVAVRKEAIIESFLPQVLPLLRAAIEGEDDDVRSVAADALLPLAAHLVTDAASFRAHGRPLLALLWLRLAVERMQKKGAIEPQQLLTVSQVINDLVGAYNSIDKVDKMVLPFPYAQLLKVRVRVRVRLGLGLGLMFALG